jgi:hypothetical protein
MHLLCYRDQREQGRQRLVGFSSFCAPGAVVGLGRLRKSSEVLGIDTKAQAEECLLLAWSRVTEYKYAVTLLESASQFIMSATTIRYVCSLWFHFTSTRISQSHPEGALATYKIVDHPLIAFEKELSDIKNNPLDVINIPLDSTLWC